ncbi:hypothetical protein BJX99DRAFT_269940 [Aspergillus californicus]
MSTEADILIIGGGTAGLVLAARLATDPTPEILVLEAGQDQTADPRNFTTVPQTELGGNELSYPAGRLLGGTSAMNGQVLIANSKANIDAWGKLGNPGWDWETLRPYYQRAYTLSLPGKEKRKELGLDYASFPDRLDDPVANAWVETFKRLGSFIPADPFSGTAIGGYTNAATIDPVTKTRSYSGNAYYLPVKELPNLRVTTGTLVTKLLFDTDGDVTVTGAQYIKEGASYTVNARKEVILSAGVFNSPKILELSGIGSDHPFVPVWFEVQSFVQTKDKFMRGNNAAIAASMEDYKSRQFGTFTVGGNYSGALLSLPDSHEADTLLDLIPASNTSTNTAEDDIAAYTRSLLSSPPKQQPPTSRNFLTIGVGLVSPLSTGSSHITSSDPSTPPAIDPRYLTHPLDIETLARHLRYAETIRTSEPLASMLKPDGLRTPDAPADFRTASLESIKTYVRSRAKSLFHPSGTCAMMPREKGGVVDARFRVWGVNRLRVVDASVFPIIPRANLQSSVYAVAERAVDVIKEDLALAG